LFQATPFSKAQKKVVELPGGKQAATSKDVSYIGGWDILDNNQVCHSISQLRVGQLCHDVHYESSFDGALCLDFLHK
jgi:hypothetical protein